MAIYIRYCVENRWVTTNNGEEHQIKKNDQYMTSDVNEDGTVDLLGNLDWPLFGVGVPAQIFVGEQKLKYIRSSSDLLGRVYSKPVSVMGDDDLKDMGFVDGYLETNDHHVYIGKKDRFTNPKWYGEKMAARQKNFHMFSPKYNSDAWILYIYGKPKDTDSIYMTGFWTKKGFADLIRFITGKELNR